MGIYKILKVCLSISKDPNNNVSPEIQEEPIFQFEKAEKDQCPKLSSQTGGSPSSSGFFSSI